MKNKIIITTTNIVSGIEIENYLGVINSNVVIGTNIFSDIGASFTDFFGGNSYSYQNKLEKMQEQAKEKLKQKLRELDGNVILGLTFDFDEISGKGKSMFMLSAMGTAVKAKFKHLEHIKSVEKISYKNVKILLETDKIKIDVKNRKLINNKQWDIINENPKNSFSDFILDNFMNNYSVNLGEQSDEGKDLLNYTSKYFESIDENYSKDILYEKLLENSILTSVIIGKSKFFDPEKILELIDMGQINISVNLLKYDKEFYNKSDLAIMKNILFKLQEKEMNNSQVEILNSFGKKISLLESLLE